MSTTDPRRQKLSELSELSELTECAYRLGVAFGAEAERAGDDARRLEYFHLFDRCFFSVRVAIGLELRLRREAGAARPETEAAETESPETEAPERAETDPSEREPYFEYDRDREREAETASLPVLLKTLNGVAADAAALPGPEPAALPTLRELLASVAAQPARAAAPRTAGLRARLAGSATAPVLTLAPPARPALGIGLPLRRATGPPRRR